MAFQFEEIPQSRSETSESYRQVYKAVGELDDSIVFAYAIANTPETVNRPTGTMFRKDIQCDEEGWQQYLVTVTWAVLEQKPFNVGSFTWRFDTTGATINIKAAKEHIASYPDAGPHAGAIGVKEDGEVEGADIVIPALKITYSFRHPNGLVTEAFARQIAAITGTVNLLTYRGFQPGEFLFIGGSGSDGTQSEVAVDYQFVASVNASGLSLGGISSIVKGGHHYAWIEFKDAVVSGKPARQATRVNIERVYDAINFASVFGWS